MLANSKAVTPKDSNCENSRKRKFAENEKTAKSERAESEPLKSLKEARTKESCPKKGRGCERVVYEANERQTPSLYRDHRSEAESERSF